MRVAAICSPEVTGKRWTDMRWRLWGLTGDKRKEIERRFPTIESLIKFANDERAELEVYE